MADSFRADHLGCYSKHIDNSKNSGLGPKLPVKTPNLDKFASEATLFYHAYPEGVPTLPVRISLFTGRYTFPFRFWQKPEKDDILLSEVLGGAGIETALVTDTYHMRQYKYGRGFKNIRFIRGQEYDFYAPVFRTPFVKTSSFCKYRKGGMLEQILWRLVDKQTINNIKPFVKDGVFKDEKYTFVARTINAAMSYLDNHKDEDNLFLWLDSFDPHEPWNPPPPFNRMYNRNYKGADIIAPHPGEVDGYLSREELYNTRSLYAGEITLVDKYFGKFVDYLKEEDFLENTLLIFLSDHGEPLGEKHGEFHERIVRKARPWLYEELVRIPLIIRHPEGYGAGENINSVVHTCDIMPTILDFMNVKEPAVMDGKSLLPLIKGEKEKLRDFAHLGWFGHSWSIRTSEFSFHRWKSDPPELYDLKNDLYERNNIIGQEFSVAKQLDSELVKFMKALWARHPYEKKRKRKGFYLFDRSQKNKMRKRNKKI